MTNEERESKQAVQRIAQFVGVFYPRCTRAELEQAAAEMVRQLTSAPADLVGLDSTGDVA